MQQNKFEIIHISKIRMNEFNVRRFEANMTPQRQARFDELTASIAAVGILEPLVVRASGIEFEIIAGERRYRAATVAGLTDIPCMIRQASDVEAFDLMVIENLQRDDLTPFETATAFQIYITRHGNSADIVADLSARTGVPVHGIRRMVRLLDLPPEIIKAWRDGSITQTHAELLTRVGDAAAASELLTLCLRSKLSTRELAERIGAAACELDRGFFDKTDCQTCPDNTSVQSGLFSDLTPAGKCSNPGCFETKQAAFFTANWSQSKTAQMFGTCSFRFGHRLGPDYRWLNDHQDTADRCRICESFISVLRLTGIVVSGYARTCIGPVACFNELYLATPAPAPDDNDQPEKTETEDTTEPPAETPATPPTTAPAKQPAKQPAEKQESGPVFDITRGERARKAFIKSQLMDTGADVISYRLTLLALALVSSPARGIISDLLGIPSSTSQNDKLLEAIFEISSDDLGNLMRQAAATQIMQDVTLTPNIINTVAERFNIDIPRDWTLNETYLASLNKSEIVRVGEEPGVGVWVDPAAVTYRQEKYKGKALMALKKEELIDIMLNSGAVLTGRVPAEVIGKRNG